MPQPRSAFETGLVYTPRCRFVRCASGWALLLGFLALLFPPSALSESIASRITHENFDTHHVGGPDSDAGIGDWFLSNGTICAALSDPSHESALAPQGGVLIDLGHCGADDDQWTVLQPMLNLSQSHVVPVTEITSGTRAGGAWLRTRAEFAGIELLTTYAVSEDRPDSLDISTRARRIEDGDALFSVGYILLHPSGQTPVFSALRSDLDRSVGFAYPETNRHSLSSLMSALIASDLTVLVGGRSMPPISYGVERLTAAVIEEGEALPLASFSVTGDHFTFVSELTRPPWIGELNEAPGLLRLAQIPFMDVKPETVLESDYRIHVGARADVSSITNEVFRDAPLVVGSVDDATARIHVDRLAGAPVTEIQPEEDGTFELHLPPGRYRLRAYAPGERETTSEFEVTQHTARQVLKPLVLGVPAWIRLPREFIGRLTFLPLDDPDPTTEGPRAVVFGANLLGSKMGEKAVTAGTEAPFLNLAGSAVDPERIAVAAGRYRVIAVRGPEYETRQSTIEAHSGEETPLEIAPLARVSPTPGWIATDFHVHSGESFDSSLPQSQQIVAFAASGAEVLVATEHDRIFDPGPAIVATGLDSQIVSITGVEVTSSYEGGDSPNASGHLNAFPMEPVARAYRGGAPNLEGRRIRDLLHDLRSVRPAPFVQLNHPRPAEDEKEGDTYFTHLGVAGVPYDPTLSLAQAPNSVLIEPSPEHGGLDLDYHGVELLNAESLLRYRRVRADWLSLMLQGKRIIGTANSDSHRLGAIVGLPRTYVGVEGDSPASFDETALMKALRAGNVWGTTGPLLQVRLDDVGLGGLHTGPRGTLHVAVDAAPWVPITEWRAYVNGELVHRQPIEAGGRAELPLAFAKDAFVTVEVEGPAEGLYAEVLPNFVPFAFTNPIFVDADANARFDAPGLPDDLPKALTDPDQPD